MRGKGNHAYMEIVHTGTMSLLSAGTLEAILLPAAVKDLNAGATNNFFVDKFSCGIL